MNRSGLRGSRAASEITVATHSLVGRMKHQDSDVVQGSRKRLRSLWREIHAQASMAPLLLYLLPVRALGRTKPKATGCDGATPENRVQVSMIDERMARS